MSALGCFLEAVFAPTEPFQTVHAHIRGWSDPALSPTNRDRMAADGTLSSPIETRLETWLRPPHALRVERHERNPRQDLATLVIVQAGRWWQSYQSGLIHTNDPSVAAGESTRLPTETDVQRHFDRFELREYLVHLDLASCGEVVVAGQRCVRLRAIPRTTPRGTGLWPHWLPHGADEYELHADPTRGVLLYIAGKRCGKIFEVCEVTSVEFDQPLDEALFTYTPQQTDVVAGPEPSIERMTVEAAAAKVLFTVFAPQLPVDRNLGSWETVYHPAGRRSHAPRVMVYNLDSSSCWIDQEAAATSKFDPTTTQWEKFHHAGIDLLIDASQQNWLSVALEREGTRIVVRSKLGRDELLELVASLAAVRQP